MNSFDKKFIDIMIEKHSNDDKIKRIFNRHDLKNEEILGAVFCDTINDLFEFYKFDNVDEPTILAMLEIDDILSERRAPEKYYPSLDAL